jgi:hypothetical protein
MEETFIPNRTFIWSLHPDAAAFYERVPVSCCSSTGGFQRLKAAPPGLRGEQKANYMRENRVYLQSPARFLIEESLRETHVEGCRHDPTCCGNYLIQMEFELNSGGGWATEVNQRIASYGYRVEAQAWPEFIYAPEVEGSRDVLYLGIFVDKISLEEQSPSLQKNYKEVDLIPKS